MIAKKVFLITILTLGIFGFFDPASAQQANLGCCFNKSSQQKIPSLRSDCTGSQEVWTAGPCQTQTPGQTPNTGCTIENGREICKLENPIGSGQKGTTEVSVIIATVIKAALGIIGAITLLMFVYGGFQWLTSAGNAEKVTAGTQTMIWAVIGVALVLGSYILLSTFLNFLTRNG
ncbi:MAG: hypothetical protein HYT15_03125 [Candidatus Magasanikbacteria bacterium]|nr:hypothetical protein [Candidatus Magasanikbacteria bacterium]